MPRVLRRTPGSRKEAIYGYKDLLRDSIRYIGKKASANVARLTSGGMTDEEILETALAPAGGMLKVAGTSKLLAGLLAKQKTLAKRLYLQGEARLEEAPELAGIHLWSGRDAFREALKVPEKEYGRIKDIGWTTGEFANLGEYAPRTKEILLHPGRAKPSTVWHEFTHARQWSPDKYSPLPEGGTEAEKAFQLRDLTQRLREIATERGMSWRDFYFHHSPIERHARGVAKASVKFPRQFEGFFRQALETEITSSKRREIKFLQELGRQETNREMLKKMFPGNPAELAKKVTSKEEVMKKFSKQGLKYDTYTEPLPGYGYHQWTFYGEGPLKGATFGTKTTGAAEMQAKVTDMMRKFSK